MGKGDAKELEQLTGADEGKKRTGKGSRNSGSESSGAETGSGAEGNRNGKTGEETGTEKEKIVPELAHVKQEPPKEIEVVNGEQKPKKRKVSRKKKDTEQKNNLVMLMVTLSGVLAARSGWEHWAISKEEAESIATPLCEVLAKSEAFSKFAEHSEAIALISAVTVVVLPRLLITMAQQKQKQEQKKLQKKGVSISNEQVRKTERDNQSGDRVDAGNGADDGEGLLVAVPAIC